MAQQRAPQPSGAKEVASSYPNQNIQSNSTSQDQPRFSQESDIDATRKKLATSLKWPTTAQIQEATNRVVGNLGRLAVDTKIRDLESLVRDSFPDLDSYGASTPAASKDVESFWRINSLTVSRTAIAALNGVLRSPQKSASATPQHTLPQDNVDLSEAETGTRKAPAPLSTYTPGKRGRPPNAVRELRLAAEKALLEKNRTVDAENQGGTSLQLTPEPQHEPARDPSPAPTPIPAPDELEPSSLAPEQRKRGRPRKDKTQPPPRKLRRRLSIKPEEPLPPRRAKLAALSASTLLGYSSQAPPTQQLPSPSPVVKKRKYTRVKVKQLAPRPKLPPPPPPPHVPLVAPPRSKIQPPASDANKAPLEANAAAAGTDKRPSEEPTRVQPGRISKIRAAEALITPIRASSPTPASVISRGTAQELAKPLPPPEEIYRNQLHYSVKDDNLLRRLVEKLQPVNHPERWEKIGRALQRSGTGVRQRWHNIRNMPKAKTSGVQAEFKRSGVFRSGIGYVNMIQKALEHHGGIATRAQIIYYIETTFPQYLNHEKARSGIYKWKRGVWSRLSREARFRKISPYV
jgi:hypothetical protein